MHYACAVYAHNGNVNPSINTDAAVKTFIQMLNKWHVLKVELHQI